MAIESNDTNADQQTPKSTNAERSAFAGTTLNATGAPLGSGDFLRFFMGVNPQQIDSTVAPYLEKVQEVLKDNQMNATLVRLDRLPNCYFMVHDAPDATLRAFGLQFVPQGEPVSPKFTPSSQMLGRMTDELKEKYANETRELHVADARVILAGAQGDMSRAEKMGRLMIRTFQVTGNTNYKNATISVLNTTQFYADWTVSSARDMEDDLSPHGTRKRIDLGMTLRAKLPNDRPEEYGETYQPIGVIGGYVEFREKVNVQVPMGNGQMGYAEKYQPLFIITTLDSYLPIEGVAGVLLAAFCPNIYNTKVWARQWLDSTGGRPQPGLLEEDRNNPGSPYKLEDSSAIAEFLDLFTIQPQIVLQLQDGRDAIPGIWRLGAPNENVRRHFMSRLAGFFEMANAGIEGPLTALLDSRYEGVYGDPQGALHDSRDIDYLSVAAKSGFASVHNNPDLRRILLGGAVDAMERPRLLQDSTGGTFRPVWGTTSLILNPALIGFLASATDSKRLTILDPSQRNEMRPLSALTQGFGSAAGIGSIISSGQPGFTGQGYSSFWNQM